MKKIAIVGPEGSGKTVMLAVLGELYSRPDRNGYFLEPLNRKTIQYVKMQYGKLQRHEWPSATDVDASMALKWNLRKLSGNRGQSKVVGEVACLDFAGEIYKAAFSGNRKGVSALDVEELKNYLLNADTVVLLLNLRDSITYGVDDSRAIETEYAAKEILKFILESIDSARVRPRVLLALSQADAYEDTIKSSGGAKGALFKYLPLVANTFGYLPVLPVHSCNTRLDANGNPLPGEPDPAGLEPLMECVIASSVSMRSSLRGFIRTCGGFLHGVKMRSSLRGFIRTCGGFLYGDKMRVIVGVTCGLLASALAVAPAIGLVAWTFFLKGVKQHIFVWVLLIVVTCVAGSREDDEFDNFSYRLLIWSLRLILLLAILANIVKWVFF